MLLRLFLNAILFSGLASATTVTFVSSTTVTSCSYKLGSGGVPPSMYSLTNPYLLITVVSNNWILIAPVPTSRSTYYTTKIVTNATSTVPPTVTVNAPKVTVTLYTSIAFTYVVPTITIPTSTSYAQVWKTVATGTFADTVVSNSRNCFLF